MGFPKSEVSDRPMMLKDFLREDYSYTSSNGFQLIYPTKKLPWKSSATSKSINQPAAAELLRSWSKKAAAKKISAIHKMINVVKFLQFESFKSPLAVLTRSNSRKSPDSRDNLGDITMSAGKLKVKDLLRWRSFRDVEEDECTPSSSPRRTTTTSCCRKMSSWCDGDFTAEDLPFSGGDNNDLLSKKLLFGTSATSLRNTKGDWSTEECEQQSPVSVLESPFREVRESINPFHPSLANFEKARCMLMQIIQEPEGITESKHTRRHSYRGEIAISEGVNAVREKAKQLLSLVNEDSQSQQANDHMILDFFMHELSIYGKLNDVKFHNEILKFAKSWVNEEYEESYDWEVEAKREAYVKDMGMKVSWNNFKQEQEDISMEFEVKVLDELINQVLVDFLTK